MSLNAGEWVLYRPGRLMKGTHAAWHKRADSDEPLLVIDVVDERVYVRDALDHLDWWSSYARNFQKALPGITTLDAPESG